MSVSYKNPFPGINPHLNSLLQSDWSRWIEFHTLHIGDLFATIKAQVMPLGYTAGLEQALQIRRLDTGRLESPKSDLTIYDPSPIRSGQTPAYIQADAMEVVIPIPELIELDEIDHYKAVAIYARETTSGQRYGEPVVWVELLSPSNKPPHHDFQDYREKRAKIVQQGIVFVEIDYLHQFPPTFRLLPDYTQHAPQSYPYRITVIDPRPDVQTGEGRSRQFDVKVPLPTVEIPLNAADVLTFDFNVPYQASFERGLYNGELDYSQPPERLESYTPLEQIYILEYMSEIEKNQS